MYLNGMTNNDAAQKANASALSTSLANMNSHRGVVSPENGQLLARQEAARTQQGQALDLSRAAAMGNAPSAATAQMGMGMNDIMSGQSGAMGGARGLAGLGGVQTQGAAGAGMAGTQAAMTGGMGRSNEIASAVGNYGQAAGTMAQGDINRLVQGDKNSLSNAELNNNWVTGNASLAANQGKLGLAQSTSDDAWYNQSQDPLKRQLSYDQRMNQIQNGANVDAADAAAASRKADEDRNRQLINGGATTGLTLVGGPVASGIGNSLINRAEGQ